ncbi:hypothetical protein HFO93_30970 [Rhizobium leguminosarum]|uniref:hypothetical protein n=1 Tax=Rhizobium leguminosarum TaxID=384 RepID=UPI001C9526FA|nr:hypothetical protein [Rhizobium leguminosarum]MBY5447785.1 hypothetical protein [Rhizobium leguminosarum]
MLNFNSANPSVSPTDILNYRDQTLHVCEVDQTGVYLSRGDQVCTFLAHRDLVKALIDGTATIEHSSSACAART